MIIIDYKSQTKTFFYNPPCLFDTLYYIYLTNKQNSLHYEKRNFRNLRSSHVGILQ